MNPYRDGGRIACQSATDTVSLLFSTPGYDSMRGYGRQDARPTYYAKKVRETQKMIRGIIYDMDGTLVDSHLDFDLIRHEMGLRPDQLILEGMASLTDDRLAEARAVLHRHEAVSAAGAELYPGVRAFLTQIGQQGLRQAILTRNSRKSVQTVLANLELHEHFDPVLTREDGPIKPDPTTIHQICDTWGVKPAEVVMVGDFAYDIYTGQRAGASTVFFTRGRSADGLEGTDEADFLLDSFDQPEPLLKWLTDK